MSVDTVLSIAGFLLIIGLILAWCAREVRLHEEFMRECRRRNEALERRDPEAHV